MRIKYAKRHDINTRDCRVEKRSLYIYNNIMCTTEISRERQYTCQL